MERLAPNDPIGLFLGEFTNSCQSIINNGRDCAMYGMLSPYSGFYVWRQKTDGSITECDPIIAESWLWISHNLQLVFDSYERSKADYNEYAQPFIEQFAHEVSGKHKFTDNHGEHTIQGVRLGCDPSGSNAPPLRCKSSVTQLVLVITQANIAMILKPGIRRRNISLRPLTIRLTRNLVCRSPFSRTRFIEQAQNVFP